MESLTKASLLSSLEVLEQTHEKVPLKGLSLSCPSKRRLRLGKEDMSTEATRDFLKVVKVPGSFLGRLSESTLGEVVREMRVNLSVDDIQVLRDSKGKIVRVGAPSKPFYKLSELVGSLGTVEYLGGIPGMTANLRVFGDAQPVDISGREYKVGVDLTTDFFGGEASVFTSAFKVICTNGMVDIASQSGATKIQTDDVKVIESAIQAFRTSVPTYAQSITGFVDRAKQCALKEPVKATLTMARRDSALSGTLVKRALIHTDKILAGTKDPYAVQGLERLDCLADVVDLLTFSAKEFSGVVPRFKSETSIFQWATAYLN